MTEADDTVEMLLRRLEADGQDMTLMRAARGDIGAMEVGDDTPAPGTLMLEPTLVVPPPPMHQGLHDTPEGPFYVPLSMSDQPATPRWARRLTKRVNRHHFWLLLLWACSISGWYVAAVKW